MADYFVIASARLTVDAKEITNSGLGTTAASLPHVTISFTKPFAAVTSIVVTPKVVTATRYFMGVIFDETLPNPTNFQVFAYDSAGVLAEIDFFWTVRGVQGAI